MSSVRRAHLLLALIVALGACGSDAAPEVVSTEPAADSSVAETPVSEATAADPAATGVCALVSQDEVSAALGNPANAGVASDEDGASVCTWESTVPSNNASLSSPPKLTVALFPFGPDEDAAIQQLVDDADNIVVDGLGDRAVVGGATLKGPLFVVVGDRYLDIELSNYGVPDDYSGDEVVALLTTVGALAVGRL